MPTHLCQHQNGPETALPSRGVDQQRCLALAATAGRPWTLPSLSKQPKPSSSGPRERIQAPRLEVLLAQGAARRSRGFLQLDGENFSARAARWRKEEEEKRGQLNQPPALEEECQTKMTLSNSPGIAPAAAGSRGGDQKDTP